MRHPTPILAPLALLLAACSPGIVRMDGDSFLLHHKSATPVFGSADDAKSTVYRDASAFCEQQGKRVETVDLRVQTPLLLRSGSASLQFRCV